HGAGVGLGIVGDGPHLVIDLIEQRRDQIHCGHGLLRSSLGCTLATSLEEMHAHDNKASKYYRIVGLQTTNTIGYYATSSGCSLPGSYSHRFPSRYVPRQRFPLTPRPFPG